MSTKLARKPITDTKNRVVYNRKGEALTREGLFKEIPPNDDNLRWTANRKALVIEAVDNMLITAAERDTMFKGSTPEEWARDAELYRRHGLRGLKVTKLQDQDLNIRR